MFGFCFCLVFVWFGASGLGVKLYGMMLFGVGVWGLGLEGGWSCFVFGSEVFVYGFRGVG